MQRRVHGPDDVRLDEVDDPGRATATPSSARCLRGLRQRPQVHQAWASAGPGGGPMPLGHELAGTVTAVGPEVGDIAGGRPGGGPPGRRRSGPHRQRRRRGRLTPQPAGTRGGPRQPPVPRARRPRPRRGRGAGRAAAVGMNAVDQAEVGPDDRVVIFGCGPIGLAALATLVDRGNAQVIAVDLSASPARAGRELGAYATDRPRRWGDVGADRGRPRHRTLHVRAHGRHRRVHRGIGGRVRGRRRPLHAKSRSDVRRPLHDADIPVSFLMLLMKQFTICGAMEYPARPRGRHRAAARRDLSSLITHRYPSRRVRRRARTAGRLAECGKVMITIPGNRHERDRHSMRTDLPPATQASDIKPRRPARPPGRSQIWVSPGPSNSYLLTTDDGRV